MFKKVSPIGDLGKTISALIAVSRNGGMSTANRDARRRAFTEGIKGISRDLFVEDSGK